MNKNIYKDIKTCFRPERLTVITIKAYEEKSCIDYMRRNREVFKDVFEKIN